MQVIIHILLTPHLVCWVEMFISKNHHRWWLGKVICNLILVCYINSIVPFSILSIAQYPVVDPLSIGKLAQSASVYISKFHAELQLKDMPLLGVFFRYLKIQYKPFRGSSVEKLIY